MSAAPVFFITPRVGATVNSSSLNTVTTPSGANNLADIVTGGSSGSIVERVIVESIAAGAVSAAIILRFFLYDGTSSYMVHELRIASAPTPSTTVIGYRDTVPELVGLKLPSSTWKLRVGISVRAGANDDFVISAHVADL